MTATDRDRCKVSPSRSRTGEMFRLMPERETWRKIVWIVSPCLTRARTAFNDFSVSGLLYFMALRLTPSLADWINRTLRLVSAGAYLFPRFRRLQRPQFGGAPSEKAGVVVATFHPSPQWVRVRNMVRVGGLRLNRRAVERARRMKTLEDEMVTLAAASLLEP